MNKLDLKIRILEELLKERDMSFYYRHFEDKTGATRKEVKEVMDELRNCGMVEHVKGLFDDDGKTAGSGFSLTYRATQLSVREWLDRLKEMQKEEQNKPIETKEKDTLTKED